LYRATQALENVANFLWKKISYIPKIHPFIEERDAVGLQEENVGLTKRITKNNKTVFPALVTQPG